MGSMYADIELLWRGYTFLSMLILGGFLSVFIGLMNESEIIYKQKMWIQCILSTILILLLEYIAGYILNIRLNLGIWDYSALPLNIDGQICLLYAGLWFLLSPLVIWTDDILRYKLYGEEKPNNVLKYYIALFTNK